MENARDNAEEGRNLVGIIPVAGHETFDFHQPWPDCMMPIGPNFNLIEAAVAECAWAGCKSIWITVNHDFAPIIRKRLGDWCGDPVWSNRSFDYNVGISKRRIPIYYVGVNPKDRHKRDCTSWSVIHGALTAFKTLTGISDWMMPSKYYVSFPHGFFPAFQLREHRKIINSKKNCYISFNNHTVLDKNFMSFTFGKEDWLNFRRVIRTGTGARPPGTTPADNLLLPPSEMWSARWFGVEKVFRDLDLESSHKIEVDNFFNVRNWEEYRNFLCSSRSMVIKRPSKSILIGTRSNAVSKDYLESDEGKT